MLKQDFEAPKKVLELNPRHPLITRLEGLDASCVQAIAPAPSQQRPEAPRGQARDADRPE